MDIDRVIHELKSAPANTKLYLGADSVRFERKKERTAWAQITTVAVIHLAGRHGCKVVGSNEIEQVFDKNLGRPQYRMMQEAYKLTELYLELTERMFQDEDLIDIPIEVHLDISKRKIHGSSCAAKQAAGYVMAMCGIEPVMKPVAWAASTAADLYNKKLGDKSE